SSDCAILEVGDASLGHWFTNVTRRNLTASGGAPVAMGRFDVVAIHRSLGGCATLRAALVAANRELRSGGTLAFTATNRLRSVTVHDAPAVPAAPAPHVLGWGLRRLVRRAGFADVSLYVTHPPARDPVYVIDACPRTARAFFRARVAAQPWPTWSLKRML